jgi:hypothetical protein
LPLFSRLAYPLPSLPIRLLAPISESCPRLPTHLQAKQSFRLISAFSSAFFSFRSVLGPGPAIELVGNVAVVAYVETS